MATRSSSKKKTKPKQLSTPTMSSFLLSRPRIKNHPRSKLLYITFFLIISSFMYLAYINSFKVSSIGSDSKFYSFDIVNVFPHDPDAFTQGLLYGGNDTLYESTGLYGRSSVRQVDLRSGKVQLEYKMSYGEFGEGLTLFNERLFQVTWLKKTGFIYDRYDFNKSIVQRGEFKHQMNDGWGLATDGKIIFGSDGTSTLYHLDPITFKASRKLTVSYSDHEISFLNELEYINGEVWANVWQTDCIARISPSNGRVQSWILLHELRQRLSNSGYQGTDVLNGIAWDEENRRLFVTGKLWPELYEIKLRAVSLPRNKRIEQLCHIPA